MRIYRSWHTKACKSRLIKNLSIKDLQWPRGIWDDNVSNQWNERQGRQERSGHTCYRDLKIQKQVFTKNEEIGIIRSALSESEMIGTMLNSANKLRTLALMI